MTTLTETKLRAADVFDPAKFYSNHEIAERLTVPFHEFDSRISRAGFARRNRGWELSGLDIIGYLRTPEAGDIGVDEKFAAGFIASGQSFPDPGPWTAPVAAPSLIDAAAAKEREFKDAAARDEKATMARFQRRLVELLAADLDGIAGETAADELASLAMTLDVPVGRLAELRTALDRARKFRALHDELSAAHTAQREARESLNRIRKESEERVRAAVRASTAADSRFTQCNNALAALESIRRTCPELFNESGDLIH